MNRINYRYICKWTAVILFVISVYGCSIRRMTQRYTTDLMEKLSEALFRQPDPELAKDGGASFLLFIDGYIQAYPESNSALIAGIKGYTAYSSAFLIEEEPERAFTLYNHALQYGFNLLNKLFKTDDFQSFQPEKIEKILTEATKYEVPAVYWTATAWSGWIVTHPDRMLGIADLSKVVNMMESVLQLDPTYQTGGVNLFFGIYYGSRSPALGGDPVKAKAHFDKAIDIAGEDLLLPKVMLAQYYAHLTFNKKLFISILQSVINAPPTENPENNLMNAIAKKRAKALLEMTEEYF